VRTFLTALALVTLTACGGSGDDKDYDSLKDVGQAAGCDPYTDVAEPMMYATETAECTLPSGDVTLNWFNDNQARDQYVDLGTNNGAVYAIGDNWAAECQTEKQQAEVAEATGGTKP
jgi:hypothetical protein